VSLSRKNAAQRFATLCRSKCERFASLEKKKENPSFQRGNLELGAYKMGEDVPTQNGYEGYNSKNPKKKQVYRFVEQVLRS